MKKLFTFIPLYFGCSFLFSCSGIDKNENEKSSEKNPKEIAFRTFIKKFEMVHLPLHLRVHEGISLEGLQKINNKEDDAFLNSDNKLYCYGILEDTQHIYSLILLYPADVMVPVIYNFEKGGKLISKMNLVNKGCLPDCGFRKCTSDCIIEKSGKITLIDTNDFYLCDDFGEEIPNSRKHSVYQKYYRISRRLGRISEEGDHLRFLEEK